MIVSGRVSYKMAPLHHPPGTPRLDARTCVISMVCVRVLRGVLTETTAVVQGCDHIVPVDVYSARCPPRP